MTNEWEDMHNFAVELIRHTYDHRSEGNILIQRINVLNLYQAMELLMKSYLSREGYIINELDQNKLKKGIKKDALVAGLIKQNKTLGFSECFEAIKSLLKSSQSDRLELTREDNDIIINFTKLRNEIQHRSVDISVDKNHAIRDFMEVAKKVYLKMFPRFSNNERLFNNFLSV